MTVNPTCLAKRIMHASLLVVITLLAGCASQQDRVNEQAYGPQYYDHSKYHEFKNLRKGNDEVQVAIYFVDQGGIDRDFTSMITINGSKIGQLRNGEYIETELKPGSYIIETNEPLVEGVLLELEPSDEAALVSFNLQGLPRDKLIGDGKYLKDKDGRTIVFGSSFPIPSGIEWAYFYSDHAARHYMRYLDHLRNFKKKLLQTNIVPIDPSIGREAEKEMEKRRTESARRYSDIYKQRNHHHTFDTYRKQQMENNVRFWSSFGKTALDITTEVAKGYAKQQAAQANRPKKQIIPRNTISNTQTNIGNEPSANASTSNLRIIQSRETTAPEYAQQPSAINNKRIETSAPKWGGKILIMCPGHPVIDEQIYECQRKLKIDFDSKWGNTKSWERNLAWDRMNDEQGKCKLRLCPDKLKPSGPKGSVAE